MPTLFARLIAPLLCCAACATQPQTDPVADAATTGGDATATDSAATAPDTAKAVALAEAYTVTAKFPEGGVYDSKDNAFLVGSLFDGSVHRIDGATGVETTLFSETAKGKWWTLGMDVDLARRRLWVCAMDDKSPDLRAGFVWIFDLTTGKRVANHPLSAAAKDATCTDVAVTKDGAGYVVDREQPNVYKVDFAAGAALFASDPVLKGTLAGQNAVVVLPDESALLSVVYMPPKLVRIGLADKVVKAVAVDGTFSDDSLLAGADGMAYADGGVYVAFTGKLVRVVPKAADWAAGTATGVEVANGMTDVVVAAGALYLLNGQAVRFALQQDTDPFRLVRFAGKL